MAEKPIKTVQSNGPSKSEKKEGWITDQDMWDVTMDMIEDATIDYSLLGGADEDKKDASIPTIKGGIKAPEKPRPVTPQSRAATVRQNARLLQQRRNNPPITRQAPRPTTSNKPPITAQNSATKRADNKDTTNNAHSVGARNVIDKSQIVDYQLDRSNVSQPKILPPRAAVVRAAQPARVVVDKKSAVNARKAPISATKPIKSSSNPVVNQRENINTVRQENYATFSAKEMTGAADTQDVTAVMKKVKRERSVKRILAIFPGILRFWLPITTAALGFFLGYYVAESKYEIPKGNQVKVESMIKKEVKSNTSVNRPVTKKTQEKPAVLQRSRQVSEVDAHVQTMETSAKTDYQSSTLQSQAYDNAVSPADGDPSRREAVVESLPDFDQRQTALDVTTAVETTTTDARREVMQADVVMSGENSDNAQISTNTFNDNVAQTSLTMNDLPALIDENLRKFVAKDWEAVISISDKILSIAPREKSALTNRSVAYTELGAYALAIDDVNIVLEIEPNNALAINNRGYAYEKMGSIEKSIEDYEFACKLGVNVSCTEATRLRATLSR